MAFTTRKTLLQRIQGDDEISWQEFYDMYSPLIRLRGRDLNLTGAECGELVQEVMLAIFNTRESFRYAPEKGKFRNYLKKVTTHCAFKILRARPGAAAPLDGAECEDSANALELRWQEEWDAQLIREALAILRGRMEALAFQAFCFYALRGESPLQTARALDISVNAVYLAKSRGLAILRDCLKQLGSEGGGGK